MARFIMAGRLQAAGFVIVFALLPLFGLLANAAIALVTLRKNWQEGLLLTLIGSVAIAIFTYIEQQNISFGFFIAWIQWTPVVLFAWVLNQTVSWKVTLQALLGLSMLSVFLLHIIIPDTTTFWLELFNNTIKAESLPSEDQANIAILQQRIQQISPLITGIIVAMSSIVVIISLLMARYWQSQLYNPGGFGEELRELRLGKASALIMIALVIMAFATEINGVMELLFCGVAVFLFQGIALIHALVKLRGMRQLWLIVLYLLLILLNFHMAVILAAVGIIDNFADFRRQFIK